MERDLRLLAMSTSSIFDANPYDAHPNLSPLEADVLWEYAKLSQHIKDVRSRSKSICFVCLLTRNLVDNPNA